jgi:hypothetical protein
MLIRIKGNMKKVTSVLLLLFLSTIIYSQTADSVSQFGITWKFDKDYQTGQFANGDYWVIGPVTIIGITPKSSLDTGRTINGSMINPSPLNGLYQGYDSETYGIHGPYFEDSLNVARPDGLDLSSGNPLIVQPHSSLVSSISVEEGGHRPQLQTAAILTVLESAPPSGSFRPPYTNINKDINYNISQLDYSKLSSLQTLSKVLDISTVADYFERPWLDHVPDWPSRYTHPVDNMPDYGRELCTEMGEAALMLNLNFTQQQKETLLIRFLQLGIDLYGISEDGGENNWIPNGGHQAGRKWPILFAGIMFNDNNMKNIGPGDGTGTISFQEDGQTFYVTQSDIDMVHEEGYAQIQVFEYEQSDLGLPDWGIRHSYEPLIDNKNWEADYRRCCTANSWIGFVLAAHIMDAKQLWQHDVLFDYMDRYMDIEEPGIWTRTTSYFAEEMWDTYRADYGNIYTNVKDESSVESLYQLYQNYPNPFNHTTSIMYSVPFTLSPVTLSLVVYNMLGQEVTTLVNEIKTAGSYSVEFNASDLSSGMYIYKIQVGEFTASKKLMLLK